MRLRCVVFSSMAVCCLMGAVSVNAGIIASTPIASGGTAATTFSGTLGWRFSTSQYIEVTHLGAFDLGLHGIIPSDVGIWTDGGALRMVTTVSNADGFAGATVSSPAGPGAFRYHALGISASNVLAPGVYRIGEDNNNNPYLYNLASPGMAAGLSFIQPVYHPSTSLAFPSISQAGVGFFGPNFQYLRPIQSVTLAPGSTIDLGSILEGGGILGGGLLGIRSIGDAGSHVFLQGLSFQDSRFGLTAGNGLAVLTSGSTENFAFRFDSTGLTAGAYTSSLNLFTNMGNFSYTLRATVETPPAPPSGVPEPSSLMLLGIGAVGMAVPGVRRRWRPRGAVRTAT